MESVLIFNFLTYFKLNMRYFTKITTFHLPVFFRGLRSRARYQPRQDKTRLETIPEMAGPGRDYICVVFLPGTIREKFGKNLGRDCSVPLGKLLNGLEMN